MLEQLKKHRFKIIVAAMTVLLVYVSFYMLWVHVPYTNKQHELQTIQHQIIDKNHLKGVTYFNEYHGHETYYILKAKDRIRPKTLQDYSQYIAYNEKYKKIDQSTSIALQEEDAKQMFIDKYEVEPTKIEVGYENNEFVYCMTYKKEDKLIYAFYGIETGEFLKAYSL